MFVRSVDLLTLDTPTMSLSAVRKEGQSQRTHSARHNLKEVMGISVVLAVHVG